MFCDEITIKLVAGKGGDGCVSFRREKFVPKGGPNGGDGGRGGDIIIKTSTHLNTLSNLTNGKVYKAEQGTSGKGKNMTGANAKPLIIEVPIGTIIYNKDKTTTYGDLTNEGEEIIIARGGKGGLGNARFVSSTHQAPRFAENGEPGEENEIKLELKIVADVGIIGLPSAGKSTLISVISNAKPKIAEYHFTTLIPNLGIVKMQDFGGDKDSSFAVADIPGLIEGASEGKGLGHQFLKHISRTKLLIHLIDGSQKDPIKDWKTINGELKNFNKKLAEKEQILVINKIDLLTEEEIEKIIKKFKKTTKSKNILKISAVTKKNLKPLLFEIIKTLQKIKTEEINNKEKQDETIEIPIIRPHLEKVRFEIEKIINKKTYKIFRVKGKRIEQILTMTDIKNPEGLERIYHYLGKLGIKEAVEKKGATYGDFYKIKEIRIAYRK